MAVELRHLRYFVAVADEGQLTRAAARLEISQPALSRALRVVEQDLGVQLLRRHARGVELTRAGRAFYPEARRALRAALEALDATRAAGRPGRELTLGFQLPWPAVATEVADATRRAHPDIAVLPRELRFGSVSQQLWERHVDAALLWSPLDEPELDYQTLLVEPVMVCLPVSHPLASHSALRFADVENEPVPRLPPGEPWENETWQLAGYRSRPARLTAEAARSLEGVAALLACGHAVCFGSRSLAHALLRPGFVARPLIDVQPATLTIAWLRDNRSRLLADLLQAARRVTEGPG